MDCAVDASVAVARNSREPVCFLLARGGGFLIGLITQMLDETGDGCLGNMRQCRQFWAE